MILLTSVCFKILINPNNASDPQQQGIFKNLLSHLLPSLFCQLSVTYSLKFTVYFHFCFLMFWIDSTFRSCSQHVTCSYSRIVVENRLHTFFYHFSEWSRYTDLVVFTTCQTLSFFDDFAFAVPIAYIWPPFILLIWSIYCLSDSFMLPYLFFSYY